MMAHSLVKEAGLILLLAAVPASISAWLWAPTEGAMTDLVAGPIPAGHLDMATIAARQSDGEHFTWIDARSTAEFEQDHVPGAIHLPLNDWEAGFDRLMGEWDPAVSTIVYCGSAACGASEQVAERLRLELGMGEVVVLHGGWMAWTEFSQ